MVIDTECILLLCINWTLNILTLITSCAFLYSIFKVKIWNYGLIMVLVLNMFSWFQPIGDILSAVLAKTQTNAKIFLSIDTIVYEFSIFWATALAIFTHRILTSTAIFYPKKFMIKSAVVCTLLISPFPTTIATEALDITVSYDDHLIPIVSFPTSGVLNQVLYSILYEVIGRLVPAIVILKCYTEVFKVLKMTCRYTRTEATKKLYRISGFSLTPLACFTPVIIAEIVCMAMGIDRPFGVRLMSSFLNRFWGFANLLIYWFMRSAEAESRSEVHENACDEPLNLASASA